MKLFNAIAAAAVIGASFIAPNPFEARNGWMFMGHLDGDPVYWRSKGCRGNLCQVEINYANNQYPQWINCSTWQSSIKNRPWTDLMPGSAGEYRAKQVCR